MKWYRRKWMFAAALTMGSVMQLTTCQQEAGLFGLRWLFSSFTLPIDIYLRDFIIGLANILNPP
jgi:hypothetical protein